MKKIKFSLRYFSFIFIGLILIGFLWNPFGLGDGMRSLVWSAGKPFLKLFYFAGEKVENAVAFLSSISSLSEENENLLKDNNELTKNLAELKDVQKENADLREQLRLSPKEKFDLEGASVIGQSSLGSGSWLMIDKGESQGVKKGMAVIVYDGILIGRVGEVMQNSSRVILLSDPGSVVNVSDVETGAKGVVRGEYSLGIYLDLVEQQNAINEGDFLVTSGLGGEVPGGLLIGILGDIRSSEDGLFQQAVVFPKVKYFDLSTVLLIKNSL